MNNKATKTVKAFSVMLIFAAFIFGACSMLKQSGSGTKSEEGQFLKERDLENAYPETPTELVKLYWRFNKYMYNKKISDEDLTALMKQLRKLYDDDFLAEKKNSESNMIANFKKDKENREDETIVSAVVEKYDSVKTKKNKDKKKYATVTVAVHTKKNGKSSVFFESFMCRTDKEKHWKILGWKTATQQEALDAGVQ